MTLSRRKTVVTRGLLVLAAASAFSAILLAQSGGLLSVTASAGAFDPDPVVVDKWTVASLSATFSDPSGPSEPEDPPPTPVWTWTVDKVETRLLAADPWATADPETYEVKIEHSDTSVAAPQI